MNSHKHYIELARFTNPTLTKQSEVMIEVNRLAVTHNDDFAYGANDIQEMRLAEYVLDNCTQREQDLIYVGMMFKSAYYVQHTLINCLKQDPSPFEEQVLNKVNECLVRLNLTHLMQFVDVFEQMEESK